MTSENYVYKKEVDWSLLKEGLTLPFDNQVVFGQIMGRFLKRGESKNITIYLDGKTYPAKITNVNFDPKFNRQKDTLQIRYAKDGEFAKALQLYFHHSYKYILSARENRDPSSRQMIRLPDNEKEYLAIYTSEYDDSYIVEAITLDDIQTTFNAIKDCSEREIENDINYDVDDNSSGIDIRNKLIKIRKLNRSIGDNLKLLYGYRCQICGKLIGEEFGAHIAEAHHIDYFVHSMNNNANNQLIVCPNHHSIIHDANPYFDRSRKLYIFSNGKEQPLSINLHLH